MHGPNMKTVDAKPPMLIYYLTSYSDLVPCHVFSSSAVLLIAAILVVRISSKKRPDINPYRTNVENRVSS